MAAPTELQSSILTAAIICCNECGQTDAYEEWANNHEEAARAFYEDGWRIITGNELPVCPKCAEKENKHEHMDSK